MQSPSVSTPVTVVPLQVQCALSVAQSVDEVCDEHGVVMPVALATMHWGVMVTVTVPPAAQLHWFPGGLGMQVEPPHVQPKAASVQAAQLPLYWSQEVKHAFFVSFQVQPVTLSQIVESV